MIRVQLGVFVVLFFFFSSRSFANVCQLYFAQEVKTVKDFKEVVDFSLKNHAYYSELNQKILVHFVEQIPQLMDSYKLIFEESDISRFELADPKMVQRIQADLGRDSIKRMEVLYARYKMRISQIKKEFVESSGYKDEIIAMARSSEKLQIGQWAKNHDEAIGNIKKYIALQMRIQMKYRQSVEDSYYMSIKIIKRYLSHWERAESGPNPLIEILSRSFVSGLDPFSEFQSREDLMERILSNSPKHFIGIEMMEVRNGLLIHRVLEGSAGQASGLLGGDIILKIQDHHLADLSLEDFYKKLDAHKNPIVKLRVLREGLEFDVQVARLPMKKKNLTETKIVSGRFGQFVSVRLNSFSEGAALSILTSLNEAFKQGPVSGLVLDLRGNSGGYVHEALQILRLFLGGQPVLVYQKQGVTREVRLESNHPTLDLPLVVLVDQGSASASELVAGVLQAEKKAIIMGSPTYGKGTAHSVLFHGYGGVQLTQEYFHFTNGESPQIRGVRPDIVILKNKTTGSMDQTEYALPPQSIAPLDRSLFSDSAKEEVFQKIKNTLVRRSRMRESIGFQPMTGVEDLILAEAFKILNEWMEIVSALRIAQAAD